MAATKKNTNTRETVLGVFQTRAEADRAVDELRRAGFREDQIGVVARNADGEIKSDKGDTYAGEGAVAGVLAGAGVGGLVGLGVLAGVIPAIGPAIAAGALGAVLLNAAGGAAIGGLVGALVGMGIPEDEAQWYEGELKAGRYLVTVHAANRYDEAWRILHGHGAYNRQHAMTASATSNTAAMNTGTMATGTAARTAATGERTMQVREEELHATKTPVEKGEVRVRKEVITEHKTLDVPVTREEVVIERRPASGRASSADLKPGEEVRIPVKEEQVRVEKEAVVKEEVRVGKRQVTETEHVGGDVKKEKIRIETEGEVDVHGTTDANKKGRGRSKS